jgi:hypothetical protein
MQVYKVSNLRRYSIGIGLPKTSLYDTVTDQEREEFFSTATR